MSEPESNFLGPSHGHGPACAVTSPLVSILIPCHNAARWLPATLESALAQSWPEMEIIVVDDGSTDDSLAVARSFEAQGVCVAAQANAGAAAARNHGLRLAHGAFIQFLDADDLLAPDKIALQLQALAGPAAISIVAGPWGRFQDDPAGAAFVAEENWRTMPAVEWLTLNFAGRGMMPPAAWLVPRALIEAAGPWDERLSLNDDGEYFTRVLLASAGVIFCPEARSYYRSNLSGSLSRRRTRAAWVSALLSQELCAQYLLAREDSPRTRRACADLLQRLAFEMWPDCPDLVARSEQHALRHGGSKLQPGGGRIFQLLRLLLGWKAARQLQHRRQQSRS